jgi:hypothetical protein
MNEQQRKAALQYVYEKADAIGYMGLDSPSRTKFQDELEVDTELFKLAGERLQRKYIKDTILNGYSKDRRYIDVSDVTSSILGISDTEVVGTSAELENGIFYINTHDLKIPCTSASFNEWQTVLKRFGGMKIGQLRFAFITCGGVQKSKEEISEVKNILRSYGVTPFIVKPQDEVTHITDHLISPRPSDAPSVSAPDADNVELVLDESIVFEFQKSLAAANLAFSQSLCKRLIASLLSKRFCVLTGLAGSGKTKLAESFATWISASDEQYCVVAVGADWTSNENLLGYADALREGQYCLPSNGVLELILKASNDRERPYFLILDEMNLSHVERYFADFLSAIESDNSKLALHSSSSDLKCGENLIPSS